MPDNSNELSNVDIFIRHNSFFRVHAVLPPCTANNTLCQNGGTCINVGTSHSVCVCPPSHSGLYCEEEGNTGAGTEQLDRSSEGEHRTSLYACHNLHVNTQIIMLCDEQCNYANIGSDANFYGCVHECNNVTSSCSHSIWIPCIVLCQ